MRAVVVPGPGPAELIEVHEDWPEPGPPAQGEVRVAVEAAGLNPSDVKIRAGTRRLEGISFPYVSGREAAGRVEDVGPGVEGLEPGQEVFAFFGWGARPGGHAEQLVVAASAVALRPPDIPVEEAAGLPLAGLTALQALEALGARAGERVLVTSGAGGVGHLAVQLAVGAGLEVVATSGPDNLAFVGSLGAAEVLNYQDEHHRRRLRGIRYVLDSVGPANIESYLAYLGDGAKVAAVAGTPSQAPAGVVVTAIRCEASSTRLTRLSRLMAENRLKVAVQQVFPLERVAEAHRLLETGHVRGKIVITARLRP